MALKVWHEILENADVTTGKRIFQPVNFNKNVMLRYARTWVVGYNNPTFTNLYLECYSYDQTNQVPVKLLHTSTNTQAKATIATENNFYKEIWFKFNYAPFVDTDYYCFILRATGYSYSASAYIGWAKAFPDPVYKTGLDWNRLAAATTNPFDIYFIGSEI